MKTYELEADLLRQDKDVIYSLRDEWFSYTKTESRE